MVFLPAKRDGICGSTCDLANHRGLVSTTCDYLRMTSWLTIDRPDGGATKNSPSNGWDDPRVGVYFNQRASFTARTPTRAIPAQTAIPVPTRVPPPAQESNTGAIVGGVVGGIAALALAIGLILFFLRKRKRHQKVQEVTEPSHMHSELPASPSATSAYASEAKFSLLAPRASRPDHPADPTSHSPVHSHDRSSPYTTPPPMQPTQPAYHPAHAPEPTEYYPPPDGNRPNIAQLSSYEMPTVKSPGSEPTVVRPWR